ncbi:MAG: hypothetical protein H0X34_07080 [Chthoniobacterales bacterium]|nr:hypothetical protein [Chthoniobacterales bacterium]
MKPGNTYYAGGVRVLVDGVPIRMTRKPSATNLAHLRMWEKHRARPFNGIYNRRERAQMIATAARDAIKAYAEALDISETQAKARIAIQRRHLGANPVLDLSWEDNL